MHRELTPLTYLPTDWVDVGFYFAAAVDPNAGPYGVVKVTHETSHHGLWRGMLMQPNDPQLLDTVPGSPPRAITYMAYGPLDELVGRSMSPMEMWTLLPILWRSWRLHGAEIDGILTKLASARHIQKQALIDIATEVMSNELY